jgi:hypothetical protein
LLAEGVLNPVSCTSAATHVSLRNHVIRWYDVGARLKHTEREAIERGGSEALPRRGC